LIYQRRRAQGGAQGTNEEEGAQEGGQSGKRGVWRGLVCWAKGTLGDLCEKAVDVKHCIHSEVCRVYLAWDVVRLITAAKLFRYPACLLIGIITPWLMARLQSDVLGAIVVCYDAVEVRGCVSATVVVSICLI
jgi:hypothetical protein